MALRWTTAVRSWRRAADANRATRRQRPPKWVCSRGIRCFGAGAGRPGLVVTDLSLVGLARGTRDERRQTRKRPPARTSWNEDRTRARRRRRINVTSATASAESDRYVDRHPESAGDHRGAEPPP